MSRLPLRAFFPLVPLLSSSTSDVAFDESPLALLVLCCDVTVSSGMVVNGVTEVDVSRDVGVGVGVEVGVGVGVDNGVDIDVGVCAGVGVGVRAGVGVGIGVIVVVGVTVVGGIVVVTEGVISMDSLFLVLEDVSVMVIVLFSSIGLGLIVTDDDLDPYSISTADTSTGVIVVIGVVVTGFVVTSISIRGFLFTGSSVTSSMLDGC